MAYSFLTHNNSGLQLLTTGALVGNGDTYVSAGDNVRYLPWIKQAINNNSSPSFEYLAMLNQKIDAADPNADLRGKDILEAARIYQNRTKGTSTPPIVDPTNGEEGLTWKDHLLLWLSRMDDATGGHLNKITPSEPETTSVWTKAVLILIALIFLSIGVYSLVKDSDAVQIVKGAV